MHWQRHETPEEKFFRKCKYMEIRDAGIDAKTANKCRDWSLNKVRKVCSGEIKPSH